MKTSGARTSRITLGKTIAIFIGIGLMLSIAPASAIAADLSATSTPAAAAAVLPTRVDDSLPELKSNTSYITINRWGSSATKLIFRNTLTDPAQVAGSTVRNGTLENGLNAVSTLWIGTAVLSDLASNLDPIKAVGILVDRGAASLGKVVLENPLIFVIAGLITILGSIWNKARGRDGGGLFKQSLSVVLVFAAVSVMTIGASQSLPRSGSDGEYVPGLASPGWLLTKVNTTISGAADAALSGVSSIDFETVAGEADVANGEVSCVAYNDELQRIFTERRGPGTASISSISKMWETSGLRSWVNAQFGANNDFANKVWCHQLEMNRGTSPLKQMEITSAGVTGGSALFTTANPKSKAWYNDDSLDNNKSMVAWAACQWNGSGWSVEPEFATKTDGTDWIKPDGCKTWWEGDQETNMDDAGFNIGTGEPNTPQVQDLSDNDGVLDYVRSLQGTDNGAGVGALIVWSGFAALVIFIILGLVLSIVVAVAKVLGVIAMATIILVLIGSLFTRDGPGPKISGLVKRVLGYSLLAAGSSAIVLLLTWLTQTMISLGMTILDPGTIPALIWTGAAPVVALFAMHALFKSFKLPSPLTAKGALAWGAAGGTAGALVGGGIASRIAGRGQSAAQGAAKRAGNDLLSRATGGKLGAPIGAGGKPRAGAGAPAIAGDDTIAGEKRAGKQEMESARNYAKKIGTAVPTSAADRANIAVREGAGRANRRIGDGLLVTARGASALPTAVPKAFEGVRREARSAAGTSAFLLQAMKSTDGRAALREAAVRAARSGAGAITSTARRAAVSSRDNAAAELKQSYGATLGRAQDSIAKKAKEFKENPVSESWKVTKGAGKVAAVTLATVATGGTALPVIAGVAGVNKIRSNRNAVQVKKVEAENQMVKQYRAHLVDQASADTEAARKIRKIEKQARKAVQAAGSPDGAGKPTVRIPAAGIKPQAGT